MGKHKLVTILEDDGQGRAEWKTRKAGVNIKEDNSLFIIQKNDSDG